jgi:hypothetical protein
MPFTISHAAAVLPLRKISRLKLPLSGLICGSMAPDFVYYFFGNDQLSEFSHSVIGSILFCLPAGFFALLFIQYFKNEICALIPNPHSDALKSDWLNLNARNDLLWVSIFFGAWTHIIWDEFTHEDRFFTSRIGWLRLELIPGHLKVYMFLQYFCSAAGLIYCAAIYLKWWRSQTKQSPFQLRFHSRLQMIYWLLAPAFALAMAFGPSLASINQIWSERWLAQTTIRSLYYFSLLSVLWICVSKIRKPKFNS